MPLKTSQTFTKTVYSLLYNKNGKTRIANTFNHKNGIQKISKMAVDLVGG